MASDQVSPLAELFGVTLANDASTGASAAEAAIVDCMALAGFTYRPIAVPELGPAPSFAAPSLAEVQASGYGIADSLDAQIALLQSPTSDPNEAYVASLSRDELQQYQAALTGVTDDEIVFDDEGVPVDAATGEPVTAADIRAASADGCSTIAYRDFFDPAAIDLLASDVYLEAQQLVQSDAEMRGLQAAWSTCMASAGYPARDQGDLMREFDEEADDVIHEATQDHHDLNVAEVDAAIDALRAREILVALIDYECSEELFETAPQIVRRVESDFIRDNEDRLIDLLDRDR